MIPVGESAARSLHSSLSSHLPVQKVEKYILILLLSIIATQIPLKLMKENVICVEQGNTNKTGVLVSQWTDSLNGIIHSYVPEAVRKSVEVQLAEAFDPDPFDGDDTAVPDAASVAAGSETGSFKTPDNSIDTVESSIAAQQSQSENSKQEAGDGEPMMHGSKQNSAKVNFDRMIREPFHRQSEIGANKASSNDNLRREDEDRETMIQGLNENPAKDNSDQLKQVENRHNLKSRPTDDNSKLSMTTNPLSMQDSRGCEICNDDAQPTKTCCTTQSTAFNVDSYSISQSDDSRCKDCASNPDEKRTKQCQGLMTFYMATRLGFTALILISLLTTHDAWIEICAEEISELKKVVERIIKYRICDGCATKILQRKLEQLCGDCAESPGLLALRDNEMFWKSPLKTGYIDQAYHRQNIIGVFFFFLAVALFSATVWSNDKGFKCENLPNVKYVVVCHDYDKYITNAVLVIATPLAVVILLCVVYNCATGPPYKSILKALKKPDVRQAI